MTLERRTQRLEAAAGGAPAPPPAVILTDEDAARAEHWRREHPGEYAAARAAAEQSGKALGVDFRLPETDRVPPKERDPCDPFGTLPPQSDD